MYSVVLMMALSGGAESVEFGRHRGCDGCQGGGCSGAVAEPAPAGCSGGSCDGCHGGCHGGGLLKRLFHRRKHGCNGCEGGSCVGSAPAPEPACGCCGGAPVAPAPVAAPCCGGSASVTVPAPVVARGVIVAPAQARVISTSTPVAARSVVPQPPVVLPPAIRVAAR